MIPKIERYTDTCCSTQSHKYTRGKRKTFPILYWSDSAPQHKTTKAIKPQFYNWIYRNYSISFVSQQYPETSANTAKTKSLTRIPTAEKAVKERNCTQMPVAKKERTDHKCLWQSREDQTTNAGDKRKTAALIRQANSWHQMKETKQLKRPQNPKRLPTCKHKVEKKPHKRTHQITAVK